LAERSQAHDWYWERAWNSARRGALPVELTWPGGGGEAVLYDSGAPRTVAGVVALLPLEIPVVHVAWSGEMVMSTSQYDVGVQEKENRTRLPRAGDISWDPGSGEIAFTYGTAECRLPSGENTVVVFGALQTSLDAFAGFCRARRFEGIASVRLSLSDRGTV
jgi:hypothetical protein